MTTTRRTNGIAAVPSEVGVFDARNEVTAAEAAYPPFQFVGLDGETYELPHPLMLKAGEQLAVLQAQASNDAEQAELALRELLGRHAPDALAAMDLMPSIVVGRLMVAWRKLGEQGVETLGEELTGRSAPNRAARRSSQTSRSAG